MKKTLLKLTKYFLIKTACLECIHNLLSSIQNHTSTTSSSLTPSSTDNQQQLNEIKISMNKTLCELALSSYRNMDEFKQELKRLCSQV